MLINYFKISATLLEWGFLINWRNLPLLSPAALQGKAMAVRRARAAQPFRGGATAEQDVAELYTSKHQCLSLAASSGRCLSSTGLTCSRCIAKPSVQRPARELRSHPVGVLQTGAGGGCGVAPLGTGFLAGPV